MENLDALLLRTNRKKRETLEDLGANTEREIRETPKDPFRSAGRNSGGTPEMKLESKKNLIAVASHDLLAVIDANFDRDDIEARWATCGYTIAAAERARAEYERIACERLSFDDVDQAITESNLSCGMFPERVKWFFKGWILSANADVEARRQ